MKLETAKEKFGKRQPIQKVELQKILNIKNINTFNQTLSNMVKFNLIRRLENGLYYFADTEERFANLEPSLADIVNKKYLANYTGIRTGAYLAYKYKLTTQVSGYYEVITNKVSKHTRAKKEFAGKVIVSATKVEINKDNMPYIEFLELINN